MPGSYFGDCVTKKYVESLQKRTLRFLYDNYDSSYQPILKLAGKSTMNVTKLRRLSTEIFKTLNNINPAFMNEFSGILIG